MHIDPQTLIAVGVAVHLLAALGKAVFKSPQRQAQINAIERKVDEVLSAMKTPGK